MKDQHSTIVDLLKAFYWFDDALQSHLRSRGWPSVPRTQSMIIMMIFSNVNRSSEIARGLGVTRQAIHLTIAQMVEAGMVTLMTDPTDGRSKCVVLSEQLEPMRRDAREGIERTKQELARRIGEKNARELAAMLALDWGPPPDFELPVRPPVRRGRKPRQPSPA